MQCVPVLCVRCVRAVRDSVTLVTDGLPAVTHLALNAKNSKTIFWFSLCSRTQCQVSYRKENTIMKGVFKQILPPPEGKRCHVLELETELGTQRLYLSLGNFEAVEIGAIRLQSGDEITVLGNLAGQQIWLKRGDTWYRPL